MARFAPYRHPGPSTPPAAALRINFGEAEGRDLVETAVTYRPETPAFAGVTIVAG